jgi:hypothetical protein
MGNISKIVMPIPKSKKTNVVRISGFKGKNEGFKVRCL